MSRSDQNGWGGQVRFEQPPDRRPFRIITYNTPVFDGAPPQPRLVSSVRPTVEPGLSEYAAEAWERMTFGGVGIVYDGPGITLDVERFFPGATLQSIRDVLFAQATFNRPY